MSQNSGVTPADRQQIETDVGWWRFKAAHEGQKQGRGLTDWPAGNGPSFEREVLTPVESTPLQSR